MKMSSYALSRLGTQSHWALSRIGHSVVRHSVAAPTNQIDQFFCWQTWFSNSSKIIENDKYFLLQPFNSHGDQYWLIACNTIPIPNFQFWYLISNLRLADHCLTGYRCVLARSFNVPTSLDNSNTINQLIAKLHVPGLNENVNYDRFLEVTYQGGMGNME